MPMSRELTARLGLEQMVTNNTDNHWYRFYGIYRSRFYYNRHFGIGAFCDCYEECGRRGKTDGFPSSGHMFPLEAKPGGVLERMGHTEATVDLMRIAHLKECGLCCEIMREDGTMMRTPELKEFARKHGLKMITVADLITYRRRTEILVERVTEAEMPTKYGIFKAYGYVNKINGEHHVALVKGDVAMGSRSCAGVHSECLTGELLAHCVVIAASSWQKLCGE